MKIKKLAIFLDTNHFCKSDKDKYRPIPHIMRDIDKYVFEKNNDNIIFLTTPIFQEEIQDKINKLVELKDVERVISEYINIDDDLSCKIESGLSKYKDTMNKYIENSILINFGITAKDMKSCCKRQYDRKPPFEKKQDSYKDYFNICYVAKWQKLHKDEYDVWFVSRDKDFAGITKEEFGIDFISVNNLDALHNIMKAYLLQNNLEYALKYQLLKFTELEKVIMYYYSDGLECYVNDYNIVIYDIYDIDIQHCTTEQCIDKINGISYFNVDCGIVYDTFDEGQRFTFDERFLITMHCEFITKVDDFTAIEFSNFEMIHCDRAD